MVNEGHGAQIVQTCQDSHLGVHAEEQRLSDRCDKPLFVFEQAGLNFNPVQEDEYRSNQPPPAAADIHPVKSQKKLK